MEKMQSGETAVILKFPVGGRMGMTGVRKPATDAFGLPDICDAASGGAWYHDTAIRETDTGRKQ